MVLRSQLIRILVLCAIVAATFGVFSGALKGDFTNWDDQVYVLENPHLRLVSLQDLGWILAHSYYRAFIPLSMLSHSADYALWGLRPWGHHLTSVILHAANSGWIFLLALLLLTAARSPIKAGGGLSLREIIGSADPAALLGSAAAALLFGIHPSRVESVAWISDRKDLLSTFFLLPSLFAYAAYVAQRGRAKSRRWYVVSLACYGLALLAKTAVLVAPFLLVLFDLFFVEKIGWRIHLRRLFSEKLPYLLLSALAGLTALQSVPDTEMSYMIAGLDAAQRALLPFYALASYLGKLVWPAHFAPVYDFPPASMMGISTVVVVLLLGLCFVLAKMGHRFWLAALLSYLLFLAPTLTFSFSGIQPMADRYAYGAEAGIFLLAGGGVGRVYRAIMKREKPEVPGLVFLALLAILFGALALLSVRQVGVWENSETLWQHEVNVCPDVALGYNNLGVAICSAGRPDEAIIQFTVALSLNPEYAHAWNNLGISRDARGDIEGAVAAYLRAITLEPDYVDAYINLGEVYAKAGDTADAARDLRQACVLDPSSPRAWYTFGWSKYVAGDLPSAMTCLRQAVVLDPRYARAYFTIGQVLSRNGDAAASDSAMRKAARLGDGEAQKSLRSKGLSW